MKASTKRALSIILAMLLFVAAIAIYASLIRPAYSSIQELRGILFSNSNLYDQEQKAIIKVQDLMAEYQGSAKLDEQLSLALPSQESVSSVMSQLNAIAQLDGIAIQSVGINYLPVKPSTAPLSSAKGIGTLRLNLKLFGSYQAFKSFLGDMEKNVRIMDVKTLKIEGAGKPNQDIFTYTMDVDTYYQVSK